VSKITSKIIQDLKKELAKHIEIKYRDGAIRYFKEEISCLGIRTPIVRKTARDFFKKIKHLEKKKIFSLCEELFELGYHEYSITARSWAFQFRKQYTESDFKMFEKWIGKYVSNWAICDDFCTHIMYYFVENFPNTISKIKAWSHSNNMWFRRASAVSFITTHKSFYAVTHNIDDVFEIAETLLKDEEDLVQKGYGWMLKAASVVNQKAVFNFVVKHKSEMPRTALRYAIEKMPVNLRREAMRLP